MSEIQELRNEMKAMFGQMNRRFDGIDQRLDGVDQRLDGMDKKIDHVDGKLEKLKDEIVHEFRGLSDTLGIPEIHERLDNMEDCLDDVMSSMKVKWITPELSDRLEVVEKVVAKHTDQINTLLGNTGS